MSTVGFKIPKYKIIKSNFYSSLMTMPDYKKVTSKDYSY